MLSCISESIDRTGTREEQDRGGWCGGIYNEWSGNDKIGIKWCKNHSHFFSPRLDTLHKADILMLSDCNISQDFPWPILGNQYFFGLFLLSSPFLCSAFFQDYQSCSFSFKGWGQIPKSIHMTCMTCLQHQYFFHSSQARLFSLNKWPPSQCWLLIFNLPAFYLSILYVTEESAVLL